MSDGDEDEGENEIDELREMTRGTDRISADAGDGTEEGEKEGQQIEQEVSTQGQGQGQGQRRRREREKEDEEDGGTAEAKSPTPSEAFEAAFEERAGRTSSAIDPRTVSARDPSLSALLLALQDADELDEVGGAIADGLGAPAPPEYDRDAVVRLAVAYALRETAPEYFEKLAERV